MANIFKSPRTMVGRAKHHLADLEAQINAFAKDKPWTQVVETDLDGIGQILKVKFTKRLSDDLPHIIFDCVNNLRPALDQAAFGIAVKHTGNANPKSAKFPFGPTETDMLNNLAGAGKDLPTEIRELFKGFKPYKGGNNALWAMNELCNAPKHKIIYPVTIGGRIGMGGNAAISKPIILGGGWDREKNEITLARITDPSGVDGQLNFNGTFAVALDDVDEVIRGQNPVAVLRTMVGEVERVLVATERECRRIGLIS